MEAEFDDCSLLPEVAMTFMNTVHCDELALVGNLRNKLINGAAVEEIDDSLKAWLDHTEAHFSREEGLMETYRFPPYLIHQREHQQALGALRFAQEKWLSTRDVATLLSYIQLDWRNWLQKHISTMDLVTARFLSQFDIEVEL